MSETSTSQDPVSYYIDHTIYTGRPADTTDRLPKEIRTYDLLDSLGITYTRADHDTTLRHPANGPAGRCGAVYRPVLL